MDKKTKIKISNSMKKAYQEGRVPTAFKKGHKIRIGMKHTEETKAKLRINNRFGKDNALWLGGKEQTTKARYKMIITPDGKHMHEHRYIMEQHLGRKLTLKEIVHHENEDGFDNRIENLKLFANKGEHNKYHIEKYRERFGVENEK